MHVHRGPGTYPRRCLCTNGETSTSDLSEALLAQTLPQDEKHDLGIIRSNPRIAKPRKVGVTQIRGPHYSAYGKRHLQDLIEGGPLVCTLIDDHPFSFDVAELASCFLAFSPDD